MNNWRLLLLALVAVVQPIASFTEQNLVDGRRQCCDRQTDTLLRDSRSSLYGAQRLNKGSALLRNSNDRDETREGRRYELRQRDTVFDRRSNERLPEDIRERENRRNIVRSTRVAHRPERLSIDENPERRLDVQRSERYDRNIRDIKTEEQSRRGLDRMTRDSLMRGNGRTNEFSSRNSLSRDDSRISRYSNERQSRDERERMSTRSADLHRLTSTSDSRDTLRQTRKNVARVDISNDNRRSIAREQVNVVRRTAPRAEVRSNLDINNGRQKLERHAGERRSLSENSRVVERVRDMRLRENSRDERRENRNRISASRRVNTERSEERRMQRDNTLERVSDMHLRENSRAERRDNRDRISVNRRLTSERPEERRVQADNIKEIRDTRLQENSRAVRQENRDHITTTRRLRMERIEERRLQTDEVIERVRDMRLRENSRTERPENRDRISATRRLTTERSEERRPLTDNVVDRVRDMRLRENSRTERPENRDRNSATRRPATERSEERRLLRDNRVDRVRDMRFRENSQTERQENRDRISVTRRLTAERSEERRQLSDDVVERVRDTRLRVNPQTERRENNDRFGATRRLTTERPEERRLQKDNVVERVRDMHPRENDRMEKREYLNRISTTRRLITLRSEERRPQADNQRQSRGQIRENTARRLSRERMQVDQRDIRESRLMSDVNIGLDRAVESRRDIRYNERQSRAARDYVMVRARGFDSRESRRVLSIDRDNRMSDRRARSLDLRNLRDTSIELRVTRAAEIVRSDDASRRHVEYRNKMDTRERDTIDSRFQNIELAKNREMLNNNDNVIEAATNWQYILYTLQGAYLCGLFVQMLTPNCSEKSKMLHRSWWSLASQRLIKVD